MKIESYITIIITICAILVGFGLVINDFNTYYGTSLTEPVNDSGWNRYSGYTDSINSSLSDIQASMDKVTTSDGFFDKILAGGGVLFQATLLVPSLLFKGLEFGITMITDAGTATGIPSVLIVFGIVIFAVILIFAGIKYLRGL